jgi:hypothetical protein
VLKTTSLDIKLTVILGKISKGEIIIWQEKE